MADLNINIPDDKLARARVAIGKWEGLLDQNNQFRSATDAEVKQFMKQELGRIVRLVERREALAAVNEPADF